MNNHGQEYQSFHVFGSCRRKLNTTSQLLDVFDYKHLFHYVYACF